MKYTEVNRMSRYIVYARMIYLTFIMAQIVVEGISFSRPLMYFVATIMHYCMILLCEKLPWLQSFHASVLVGTYSSFCLNDPVAYPKRSEHLSLLIGFIAL